jgi:hypothetical protein
MSTLVAYDLLDVHLLQVHGWSSAEIFIDSITNKNIEQSTI